jgi:5'(3')-deoxyribonucleotidase
MIIGIDVDLTLVNSLENWVLWYEHKTGHSLLNDFNKNIDHGLNIQKLMIYHDSPLDYWKLPDLYDNLHPMDGCVQVVKYLQEIGHDIIFISYCVPSHIDSKTSFLNRNFGPDIKLIDTKHKEYVKMDMFIDDHSEFLDNVRKLQPDCITIQKKTIINSINTELYFENWDEFLPKFEKFI